MTKPRNMAASVRYRLADLARQRGEEFQNLLTRFVIERFLRRLGVSNLRGEITLKGANLFRLWCENPHRPTRDLDFLASGESSIPRVESLVRLICRQKVEEDGLVFDTESVRGERIREDNIHDGVRVCCVAMLEQARIGLQIDFGFGDIITPGPTEVRFPTILDFPAPSLAAYSRETVIAEKTHAMVTPGMVNSRMKDFFDIWFLACAFAFEGKVLQAAIASTFGNRNTGIPPEPPVAFTEQFSENPDKLRQWAAFLKKGKLDTQGQTFQQVCGQMGSFLLPPLMSLAHNQSGPGIWQPKGPWTDPTHA